MEFVIFADGTTMACPKFSYLPDMQIMYILLDGIGWQEATEIFADPEKTKKITFGDATIEGYTHLDYIMPEAGGMKARLSPAR